MWYRKAARKTLILMRGVSGSGKSSLARSLGEGGKVLSTDDEFMVDGEYRFDPEKIGENHGKTLEKATALMNRGVSPLVIDNTNMQAWEMKPYVLEAKDRGYEIEFREPDTPWKFDAEELARRNSHGVPLDIIRKMIDDYEEDMTVDKVLESKSPFEMMED